jgi:hypothetical protein
MPSLERYSRIGISVAARTPSQEQPAGPRATQRRASNSRAGHAARSYRYFHSARDGAPFARPNSMDAGACSNIAALTRILRECRWSNGHRGGKKSRPATPQRRSRRWVRKSQSALYLEATPRSFMTDSASIAWMSIVFYLVVQRASVDELVGEGNRSHLSHQRRIKSNFVQSIQYVAGRARNRLAHNRIDVNDDNVRALAAIN